jgi:nucleotide-binding universal stress UspA family protein
VLAAVGSDGDAQATVAAVRLLPGPVEVLAVHVPRRVAVHASEGVAGTFVELGETSDAVLAEAHRRFRESRIRVTTRELDRDGGIPEAISDAAREWDADAIVVGPRRPSSWEASTARTWRVISRSSRARTASMLTAAPAALTSASSSTAPLRPPSTATPRNPKPPAAAARTSAACSPTPPVKTSASCCGRRGSGTSGLAWR